jgi:hypothetical protein
LVLTPEAQATKQKNSQVGLHLTKSFYTGKKTINKMKKPTMEYEKIFEHHLCDKRFLYKNIRTSSSSEQKNKTKQKKQPNKQKTPNNLRF